MKLLINILLLFCFLHVSAQSWTAKQNTPIGTGINGFYEYLPAGYSTGTKYPCIIYWHGLGEVGNGNTQLSLVLNYALPKTINTQGFPYNAIVICPQLLAAWPGWFRMEDAIDYVRANYSVDTNKIHMTGFSMGGGALNDWAEGGSLWKVASLSPVSMTGGWNASYSPRFKAYPIAFRITHGDADQTQSVNNSIGLLQGLNNAPGINPLARMDTLVGSPHMISDDVYSYSYNMGGTGQNLIQWILSKDKSTNQSSGVTMLFSIRSKVAGVDWRLRMYSDGTWTREQFISGSWQIVNY